MPYRERWVHAAAQLLPCDLGGSLECLPQLLQPGAIRRRISVRRQCSPEKLSLLADFGDEIARERVGKTESNEIGRIRAFAVGKITTRASCGVERREARHDGLCMVALPSLAAPFANARYVLVESDG